jgi:hypothetical protein
MFVACGVWVRYYTYIQILPGENLKRGDHLVAQQGWWNYVETYFKETDFVHIDWLHVGQWQAVCYGNKALVAEED